MGGVADYFRISILNDIYFDLEQLEIFKGLDKEHYYDSDWKDFRSTISLLNDHKDRLVKKYKEEYGEKPSVAGMVVSIRRVNKVNKIQAEQLIEAINDLGYVPTDKEAEFMESIGDYTILSEKQSKWLQDIYRKASRDR